MEEYADGALAFRLRQELRRLESYSEEGEPVGDQWASFGVFRLVGNGVQTNVYCGRYLRLKGCGRVELHNRILNNAKFFPDKRLSKILVKGQSLKDQVYYKQVHHWCNKPSCSVCFRHGWAVRSAGEIEHRLKVASKRFGKIEHIVVSVPSSWYGLELKVLRERVKKVLLDRGVIGGVLIFHGFRYADFYESRVKGVPFGWYWSVHFHVLGFIVGGFRKCRRCEFCDVKGSRWQCSGCDGFYGRSKEVYKRDKCIVEVQGERKTVFGTAWYQLEHATVDSSMKRFHVYTYFGVVSYRKLKVTVEKREDLCSICKHDLVKVRYFGGECICHDRGSSEYRFEGCLSYYDDHGNCVWIFEEEG